MSDPGFDHTNMHEYDRVPKVCIFMSKSCEFYFWEVPPNSANPPLYYDDAVDHVK